MALDASRVGAAHSFLPMPFDVRQGGSHVDRPHLCAAGALVVAAERGAPEWVNIVPLSAGASRIEARDGRVFIVDDPAALVAASNAELERQRGPHPVDKDHQMNSWLNPGGPALGWAKMYEARDDGIYAQVDWLPKGAALIESGEYRYTSVNVYCDLTNIKRNPDWGFIESADFKMKRLAGFTITNIPALEVYSMAGLEHHRMSMEKILLKLGLQPTAGPDDLLSAIERLAAAGAPDLARYVPRADFDALQQKLTAATSELDTMKSASAKAEHDRLIADALKDGKITPASEGEWREYLAAAGAEKFQRLMSKLPEIAGRIDETRKPPPAGDNAEGLTPAELHACRVTGMTPQEYAAAKAELAKKTRAA